MFFSKHLSKTPDQLELHKAALLYHKQKHTLSPMQQVQKSPIHPPGESIQHKVGASSDSPISIGNVFQDGISSLPVVYLPKHHLVRLRKSRTQKFDNVPCPTVEGPQAEETNGVERSENAVRRNFVQEDQLLKTDVITHKTSTHINNLFRPHFPIPNIRIFSNRRSEEPPKTKIEEKANTHIKEAAEAATKTAIEGEPTPPILNHDSNWPLSPPENVSTCNLARGASAEQNHDYSEKTITVEKDNKNEGDCHDLQSKEINETVPEEKLELDIGSSEASEVGLYQAWKGRILELSGAKEVN
ncbi:hypothetical protein BOTCAL_0191g00040 [Botryotinia calthae]|uniref:Uncharacterized protein n=1 Tax=Botryotinia calthae TaxID=38488 RepID=A0A4Y8CZU7_9HELO|nr:hypothetical protein BOTCAL_0191g00040 [Botryotinia calthae]